MILGTSDPGSGAANAASQPPQDCSANSRTPRALTRLNIIISGKQYTATKWNNSGCTVESFNEPIDIGDRLSLELCFNGVASQSTITCEGEVKWKKANRIGLRFGSLPLYEQGLISHQLREALKLVGKTKEDFRANSDPSRILELDNVKTIGDTKIFFAAIGNKFVRLKNIRTGFAAAAMLVVFTGIAAHQARSRVTASGTIVSDYEIVSASETGSLAKIAVRQGQEVAEGQPLFMIRDEDSYNQELTRLKQLRRDLEEAEAKYEIQKPSVNPGAASYAALLKQRELQSAIFQLYENLSRQGAVSKELLLEKQKEVLKLDSELSIARSQVHLTQPSRKTYEELASIFIEPKPESVSQHYNKDLNPIYKWYYSPAKGRVLYLPRIKGSTVNQGDSLAVIQPSTSKKKVRVYLLNEAQDRIEIGNVATVVIPSLSQQVKGVVVGIDKRGGVVLNPNENRVADPFANYLPMQDRPSEVLVQLEPRSAEEIKLSSVGMKVSVTIYPGTHSKYQLSR